MAVDPTANPDEGDSLLLWIVEDMLTSIIDEVLQESYDETGGFFLRLADKNSITGQDISLGTATPIVPNWSSPFIGKTIPEIVKLVQAASQPLNRQHFAMLDLAEYQRNQKVMVLQDYGQVFTSTVNNSLSSATQATAIPTTIIQSDGHNFTSTIDIPVSTTASLTKITQSDGQVFTTTTNVLISSTEFPETSPTVNLSASTDSNGGVTTVSSTLHPTQVSGPSTTTLPPTPTDLQITTGPGLTASGDASAIIIGSTTITPGGPAFTTDVCTVSLGSSGILNVCGSTTSLAVQATVPSVPSTGTISAEPTTSTPEPEPIPTQSITPLEVISAECFDEADFPGHADIQGRDQSSFSDYFCNDWNDFVDDGQRDIGPGEAVADLHVDDYGVNYWYEISWVDGCVTTVDRQDVSDPLGEGGKTCKDIMT
ncbi:hypothetical protein TI39_contig4216g00016 [Zymoseptoria brevis]|uniref:Uncharacterized protein n=1 Tax=Zymoseptoria brevis TaxID=1047168 RepID=A0A0F4G9P5_9PEZI|nr:hypothetical protein TI39_contig4216g00016 [Zymoseptoria brevis]